MKTRVRWLMQIIALPIVLTGTSNAQDWFSDDFEDGVIDPSFWSSSGDIYEDGGYLVLLREDPDDWVETVNTFSGDWIIEMDIRLEYIVWNDMFHGIAIGPENSPFGVGISFGYSQYGKLYLAQRNGAGGTSYYYGPDGSNLPGQWLHWTFEKQGSALEVLVDGVPVPGIPTGTVVDGSRIYMPGLYEDGDGPPHVGYTCSSCDVFSIAESGSALEPRSWATIKAAGI